MMIKHLQKFDKDFGKEFGKEFASTMCSKEIEEMKKYIESIRKHMKFLIGVVICCCVYVLVLRGCKNRT